jgi:hypothetical protein
MNTMKSRHTQLRFSLLALLACAYLLLTPEPSQASFWDGFKQYWGGFFRQQNGIVSTALIVGAVSVFIITRGKWKK